MSNVGKLLVFLQLALSIVFASMAGAVYTAHTNWKKKAEQFQADAQKKQTAVDDAIRNAETEKNDLTTRLDAEKNLRLKAESDVQTLQVQVSALQKDKTDLQNQLSTQTALAETKATEANYRNEEALKQRIINTDVQKRLDEAQQELRTKTDDLFATRTELTDLQQRYTGLLEEKSDLEKLLASADVNVDRRMVKKLQSPPPVVDGIVSEVKNDRTGRAKMIVITVGSDDGLVVGHELFAYRSGVDGRQAQYLGRVKVVDTRPDEAVCEVVQTSKNGIIEKGDNVTTKLL
jgi:chromosome segregation ATPase